MKHIPDWKETFKDFPEIPESKRWSDSDNTPEQIITKRLINGEKVSDTELEVLQQAIDFYEDFFSFLQKEDFSKLSPQELSDFKVYYDYAFNHILMVRNDLKVTGFYRLVKNATVPTDKNKIRYKKYLSYPPIDIVRKNKTYNRANTPDFNLFYATDSYDSALMELKPVVGDIVSIGTWIPIQENTIIKVYPITFNPLIAQINVEAKHGYLAFQELKEGKHPMLNKFTETIFRFFSDEFAKEVNDHWDYFISARFAKRILVENNSEPEWIYEGMVYPSVGNKHKVDNIVVKPEVIDSKFKLDKVVQFRITETKYDLIPSRNTPEEINVVGYDCFEETDWIDDGYIVWD